MIVIPFEVEHFKFLELQEKQKVFEKLIIEPDYANGLKIGGDAWTLIEETTLCVIGCAGIINAGFGRGIAWALLSKHAKNHMLRITRETKKRLTSFTRIEITVNFKEGHRWAEMLGFKCETPNGMENFMEDETHYLYSRT